jgi:chromosome segregation ATPase
VSPAAATVLSSIVTGLGVVIVAILTTRANRKGERATEALGRQQAELNERVVDREDFESIVEQLRTSLADVRAELAQVKTDLEAEATARRAAERRATAAERRADAAERKATDLEERVTHLERENEKLRDDLAIATRLLEQKYPDEPDEAPDLG